MNTQPIADFIKHHYRHFNSAALIDAAEAYKRHLADGGKMMVTLAGAMSTAEIGRSLAEMIRQDKVHAISCTGANLEEDVFNLVAHEHYQRIPDWRQLSVADEQALEDRALLQEAPVLLRRAEAFHDLHAGAVVPAPVEQDDLAGRR